MDLFDIIGPVMVGPSSSHTAGAVKIGLAAKKLFGYPIRKAEIDLYGSFLATGKGHGTPMALVAGLLGMQTDDRRIPESFSVAEKEGLAFHFGEAELKDAHPNSALLKLSDEDGHEMEIVGESLGGGRINIASVDGMKADFDGESPTLIAYNHDQPGCVMAVTSALADAGINIATMKLVRDERGGLAVMVIECDEEVPDEVLQKIRAFSGINRLIFFNPLEES